MERYLIEAHGEVQGVGFRAFCQNMAKNLNIMGYAKNMPEGYVESAVVGRIEDIESYCEELKNSSPGHLERIVVSDLDTDTEFKGFDIL
ncbi:acylphosphatase [Candidatus Synchoanobacter obligatus]|uniref:acylphosphatase n=1 Tax=Candidatus Synchoanobacter obligatus TaxID=2919597 RepID=A0ABT1L7Q3_9GAMM|nr:acylphosphatase [Candidatus Synchoanobacter obligatus]MCP8352590.1 acylphosphatase [Candidatus Synchoanobacter obligatus]